MVKYVCFSFRFDLQLKVFCEAGYYGSDCSIFCQESDDDTGHFKCDPVTGAKLCMSGKFYIQQRSLSLPHGAVGCLQCVTMAFAGHSQLPFDL